MFVRSLARASMLFRVLVGAVLAVLTIPAHAGPPVITGSPATVAIPNLTPTVTINLRELGVIRGSAPLLIDPSSLQILVNGTPTGTLLARLFPNNGPGHVCVVIENIDFTFGPGQTFGLRVGVTNLAGQQVGPVIIPVTNTPGPTVDNTAEQAACDDRNTPPVANAGPDRIVNDTNGQPGETVVLDGSASTDVDPDNVLTYQWFDLDNDAPLGPPSASPTLTVTLGPGAHNLSLSVNDDSSDTGTGFANDGLVVTVNGPVPPIANAGADQTLNDTNGQPGETVTLNGSGSTDPDGTIASYEWIRFIDADTIEPLGNGQTITVTLPDGVNDVRLNVIDNAGNRDTDSVVVTVNRASLLPTANAGADRNIPDSDGEPGETVTLDGSASSSPEGTIVLYEWFRRVGVESSELLGTGPTLSVTLPDGINEITLVVSDSASGVDSDVALITVAEPPPEVVLSEIPNLTPNQSRMANKLDSMCDTLATLAGNESPLSNDQNDLLAKCGGIRSAQNATANQIEAIEELIPDDFAVARTQTLLFANTQYASIMDRLMALRGGARGLSLAGLNIIVDGKMVPLAQIEDMVKQFLGGGASADGSAADEPGGLLSDKWGLWARGNFSFGEKDASAASPAFDADQWAFVGGLDYRLSEQAVLGTALSYGSSSVEFDADDGKLDTDSFSVSLYGSAYAAKNFYFDGIFNFQNSSYDAFRNIVYIDGSGPVTADAAGDTDGTTLSGGLSAGYDFLAGGLTISPNLGFFYIDTTIDGFQETGAGGLNLIYDEQKFESLTGNLGLRLTYAWNVSWGVLLPHLRVDYVREFEDDVDVFGVRFANDPNAASTPPVLVATDNPDQSYWRLAGGFSAQFKHGVSGYIEYQRLESFEFISFQDVSIGLRFQRSF
jgi:outer membrane autotransporter protein